MNKKTKFSVSLMLSAVVLFGLFAVAKPASAITCDSATLTGTVQTGTPPTHARFYYSTDYNSLASWSVANQTGTPTPVQNFNDPGSFPIQQFISGLTQNTTYYYRLVVTNNYGTAPLNIQNFSTPSCEVSKPTVTLTANPQSVAYNGSSTLTWYSTNATPPLFCEATGGSNNWAGTKSTSGSFNTGNLTNTTTYNITCSNGGGSTSASVTVNVGGQPQLTPTVNLTADNTNLTSGNGTYLRWSSTNATSCSGSNFNANNTSGSVYTGPLYGTTTYSITCTSSTGQTAQASVTVNVGGQINPTGNISATSCTINSGASTCDSQVTWNTSNLIPGANTAVTRNNSNNTTVSTATSGNTNVAVNFGTTTFYLYHNSNPLATTTATASCATNTSWNGSVCASSTVNNPTVTLTADDSNVVYNGSTYLRWTSTNASSCNGTNGNAGWLGGKNVPSGSYYTGPISSTTTYTITCTSSSGQTVTNSVTVNVGNNTVTPTVTLTADSTNLTNGNGTYIRWNSANASYCSGSNFNANNTSGSVYTGPLYGTTTYSITCTSSTGQTAQSSVTVSVNGGGNQYPTVTLTADSNYLSNSNGTYLRWYSNNASSCYGTNFNTNGSTSGSYYTGILYSTTTYNITCSNSSGQSAQSSTTVTVNGGNQYGNVSANTYSATNIGNTYATLNGYVSSNGGSNVNAWFEWGSSSYYNNYGNQTNQTNYGSTSGTSYSYYLTGLTPNTTYYYRAVAQGYNGQLVYGSQVSFTTTGYNNNCGYYGNCYNNNQPIVTTYSATSLNNNSAILNGYVDPNGSSYTTRWFEWGTSNSYLYTATNKISQGSYAGNFSDTIYGLSPNTIYYYRAAAQSNNGQTVYGNTLTFSTSGNNYNNCTNGSYCVPTATTSMATNIGTSSARLNGLALVNNSVYTTGYFEYGLTQNLGRVTESKSLGSTYQSYPFYQSLFSLASNTTYYFRAVVTNQYGTGRGEILSFTTGNPITYVDTTTRVRTIYRNTTVVSNVNDNTGNSRPSLVFLNVSRNGETISRGSTIEYVINYKNVSSRNLRDIVLQVAFPQELRFIEASRGTFSPQNNVLLANIGNLNSQEEGGVRVTVQVTSDGIIGKTIVVTANLAYTIVDNNTQEEVFAYSKNTIQELLNPTGIDQSALAFLFGGDFLPNTLLGWLLLILFIVLLILAIRKAYYGPRVIVTPSSHGESSHDGASHH